MVWANFEKKKILAWETEVGKGVCLRRLAKFIVHSKRFQSSYCAKVVAKTNWKWSGKGEGRRGNACPQTPWSFPSLPSSSLSLITIFCSCPNFLDELTRKRLLSRLKFTTRKFRPGITFAISTNKLYLPKNGCEGPKLGCLIYIQGLVKKYWMGGVGQRREGVGYEVLNLVQGVGRAIFSYPWGGSPYLITYIGTNY